MTCLPLPRGCRLILQALASRINVQNAGSPPPSFEVQQPQLDNTRASSMIAAADTHTIRPKLVAFHALWVVSSLAVSSSRATRRRSHSTRLAGGVVARCHPSPRTQPRDPAIWVWRSLCRSLALLQTYIAHPDDFIIVPFSFFEGGKDATAGIRHCPRCHLRLSRVSYTTYL